MKTENISKKSFKTRLVLLTIFSPIIFLFSIVIIFVLIAPFIENRFTEYDSFYLSGIISLFSIILPLWVIYIFKCRIGPITQRQKIEHVARQIADPFDLSFDEVEMINRVEGWEYRDGEDIRLNENELKEAFILANEIASKDQISGTTVPATISSFVMSLILLSAIGKWRNPNYWPLIGIGAILFCFSLYLFVSYRKNKKYYINKNREFQKLNNREKT